MRDRRPQGLKLGIRREDAGLPERRGQLPLYSTSTRPEGRKQISKRPDHQALWKALPALRPAGLPCVEGAFAPPFFVVK